MPKYFDWLELIPLSAVMLCFVSEPDMIHHAKRQTVGFLLSGLLYLLLYGLMIKFKINRYVALVIAFVCAFGICCIKYNMKRLISL